jgi:hypothetical protein
MLIQLGDRTALRRQFLEAEPFPFVKIDNFLDPAFVAEVATSYPTFESALGQGRTFKTVNERKKVQITDTTLFPDPVARLNTAIASPEFLTDLSHITGIPNLLADNELVGGGIHVTGPGGRLDVHVDFNYIKERDLHRRINLLLYLNPVWEQQWGGHIQLWDEGVKHCRASFAPALNRCVIFETSEKSFHGVTPVTNTAPYPRQSFAAYYYTREAPANWKGVGHSTVFKARPEERLRRYIFMPASALRERIVGRINRIKRSTKRILTNDR